MKYTVAWVEVHQAIVDAPGEDEAIGIARSQPPDETFLDFTEDLTEVVEHGPDLKLVAGGKKC